MMADTWINPFVMSGEELCSISTGAVPTPEAIKDMCQVREIGETAYLKFVEERLSKNRFKSLFDPIHKLQLASFETNTVKSKITKEKNIELKADKNIFSTRQILGRPVCDRGAIPQR